MMFAAIGITLAVVAAVDAFVVWCCCVVAKRADEQMEAEWQARKDV